MAGTVMSLFLILAGNEGVRMTSASIDTVFKFLPPWGQERNLLRSVLCRLFFLRGMLRLDCHALSMRTVLKLFSMNHYGC